MSSAISIEVDEKQRVLPPPSFVRDRYARLVLVSHPRHLADLKKTDTDQLVVTHAWQMSDELARDNWHVVNYQSESFYSDESSEKNEIYVACHDWIYDQDGRDVTMFRGVSLGRRFHRDVSLVLLEYRVLRAALERLLDRYRPTEVVFKDYRSEFSILGLVERRAIVAEVCAEKAVALIDRADPPADDDPELPFIRYYGAQKPAPTPVRVRCKQVLASAWSAALAFMGQLRRMASPARPSVLLVATHLVARPLLERFSDQPIFAMVWKEWFPGKSDWRFVLRTLAHGVIPVGARRVALTAEDLKQLRAIHDALSTRWESPAASLAERLVRELVTRTVLDNGRLRNMAEEVVWAEAVLDRHKANALLTDGLENTTSNIFLILAKKRGMSTAFTWHGPFFHDLSMDILGCDPRVEPVVDWVMSWGRSNEAWLDNIGARVVPYRTGNPVAMRSLRHVPIAKGWKKALVLQYGMPQHDIRWPHQAQFPLFVDTVRMLNEMGIVDVSVKIHPGAPNADHYKLIARRHGLKCTIYKNEPFDQFVQWADFAIGPACSGAMLEVLGAGKPYFPLLVSPHSVNPIYFEGQPIYRDLESLRLDLEARKVPDFSAITGCHNSADTIADPPRRLWNVLSELVVNRRGGKSP